MKQEIPFRINVLQPPTGVSIQVQRGRDELLPPALVSAESISFDFDIMADISSGSPNFLGKYAQGPKDARFVYVNSGKLAGQTDSCWERRAKISLMGITREQAEAVITLPDSRLEVSINGTGGDGGPVCASVKGVVWRIVKK